MKPFLPSGYYPFPLPGYLGYSPLPLQEEKEVHLRDCWKVIRKRRWIIIALFFIVLIATAMGTLTMKPIYRGTATIQINPGDSPTGQRSSSTDPYQNPWGRDQSGGYSPERLWILLLPVPFLLWKGRGEEGNPLRPRRRIGFRLRIFVLHEGDLLSSSRCHRFAGSGLLPIHPSEVERVYASAHLRAGAVI